MKTLKNVGKTLNRNEQLAITGGQFCAIHCLSECLTNFVPGSPQESYCVADCRRQERENGGGF